MLLHLSDDQPPFSLRHVGSRGAGGAAAPQILADQKAPPGSVGAPHYYMPPQIFRLWHVPETRSILYKFVLFEVAMNFGIVYKGCCDILGRYSDHFWLP